ncbi:MAG: Zn-dependent alcohol dehydrogenase [Porticoccaceae bacterium]|nr:MAG: Zn-dependent alcohol dehydrogenase [Porticoccaceae bacterium]
MDAARMQAVMFPGPGRPLAVVELPVPRPGPGEVLLTVSACGICGSDLAMTAGGAFGYPPGRLLGHEFGGRVVARGPGATRFAPGQRVACLPARFCGNCERCRAGRPLFCSAGGAVTGGMAEFAAVPESSLFALPDGVADEAAALAEPLACGRKALRTAAFAPGQDLTLVGAGSMALAVLFWARRLGAGRIRVITGSPTRRAAAEAFGADDFLEPGQPAPPDSLVVECTGAAGALEAALQWLAPGGALVSLGMGMASEPLVPAALAFREISLHFPVGYAVEDFAATVRALAAAPEVAAMVSECVPLAAVPAAFERLRRGQARSKVLVVPRGGHS